MSRIQTVTQRRSYKKYLRTVRSQTQNFVDGYFYWKL